MNRIEVINPNFKGVSTLITLLDLDVVSLEKWLLMFANVKYMASWAENK
jgi:hypothetical protein